MLKGKVLVAGLLGVVTLALAAQDAQPIQRVLTENTVETYKSTAKVNQTFQSPLGDMPINISTASTYSLKTGKLDPSKGNAAVEFTSTIDSIDGGDSPLTAGLSKKKPAPIVQQGTIDKFGHLDLKAPEGADKMIAIFSGITGGLQASMFVELPEHPVKVGDSWDIIVPKGDFTGDTDQKITAKLTGDKKVDGKDAWVIDLSGTVNINFDSAKLASSGSAGTSTLDKTHILAKGQTMMKGTGLVEKSTGKTLSLDATSDLKTNIELPDEGDMTATGAGTMVTALKLQN